MFHKIWKKKSFFMHISFYGIFFFWWLAVTSMKYIAEDINQKITVGCNDISWRNGHLTLVAISGTTILVPYLQIKSLKLIWRLDTSTVKSLI